MRYLLFTAILASSLSACNINDKPKDPVIASLKGSDRIDIVFYNNGDSLNFQTKDPKGIEILTSQISGDKDKNNSACPSVGELRFMQNDQLVYTAQFAIDTANKSSDCNFVIYNWQNSQYKHNLTERGENMLQKIYAGAQKPTPQQDTNDLK